MNPKMLSFESLMLIHAALDARSKALESLHWQVACFGGTNPIYTNIVAETAAIEKARHDVSALFESQYSAK